MKRKEYRVRQTVTFSAEKDRYSDFEELCDKERKSISLKLSEMIEGELEKNEVGPENPIGVSYNTYVSNPKKPLQADLIQWMEQVHEAKNDDGTLNLMEGMGRNIMVTAKHYLEENRRRRIMRK